MGVVAAAPVRVRLRGAVDDRTVGRVASSVRRQAGEALRRLQGGVEQSRGTGWHAAVVQPVVHLHGSLPSETDRLLRRALVSAVDGAIEDSGVLGLPRRDQAAAGRDHHRAERLDTARFDRRAGTYRLESYDDDEVDVPVQDEAADQSDTPSQPQVPTLDEAIDDTMRPFTRRHGIDYPPADGTRAAYYGTVTYEGRTVSKLWVVSRFSVDEDGDWKHYSHDHALNHYSIEDPNADPPRATVGPMRLHSEQATLVRTDEVVDLDSATEAARSNNPTLTPSQARAIARAQLSNGVGERVFWQLTDGGSTKTFPGPRELPSPIEIKVGPFLATGDEEGAGGDSRDTDSEQDGDGTGEESGEGDGDQESEGSEDGEGSRSQQRGGPLGIRRQVEGEGALWPNLLEGEPGVCEPYLGEPPVSELVTGGEQLEDTMRALAQDLEVPYCGYAGKFAINCAAMVGGRALEVGVVATVDETATTVRASAGADGQVQLDIQPTRSPALQYLRLLAEIGRRVRRFIQRVQATMVDRENAPLVYTDADRDGTPDAWFWSREFLNEAAAQLESSYAEVFAQTCRVILLQQLRASAEFIHQRRYVAFEATLKYFEAAFGVLGDALMRLRVLRRALRFAANPSLATVYNPGGPTAGHGYRGGRYEVPPLIEQGRYVEEAIRRERVRGIPEEVFEPLDSAVAERSGDRWIVRHDDEQWTVEELDREIELRTNLLNSVDPLFYQIEDKEELYRRFRRDPGYLRTWLRDLLKEMDEANVEITRKTTQPGGAWFAVETSQYMRTESAFNSRGLRFQMVGIHGLADDQLRSPAGDNWSYVEGVNNAVGRKAARDLALSIGISAFMIGLAIFCAPLGAVVAAGVTGAAGLGLTALDYLNASEREELYRALRDPELILSWHEVELEYLFAHMGAAFAIFDVFGVGKAMRGALGVARQGVRQALETSVRQATREGLEAGIERVSRRLTRELLEEIVKGAYTAVALEVAMRAFGPVVFGPVMREYVEHVRAEHGGQARIPGPAGGTATTGSTTLQQVDAGDAPTDGEPDDG